MQLTVRDAARIFNVSENILHRWIDQEGLPHDHAGGQIRFHRTDLLEWAAVRNLPVELDQAPASQAATALPAFSRALSAGGIHRGIEGRDRDAVLRAVVARLELPKPSDREMLLKLLLARESLGSTGIGDGIAIPHVRNPIVFKVGQPAASLFLLEKPVDFHSPDGQPVHALFLLVTPTVKIHLHLVARLCAALQDGPFHAAIAGAAPEAEILAAARAAEERGSAA